MESSSPAAPQQFDPGWYSNPNGPGQRYWDGSQWTEHFHPAQQAPSVGAAPQQRPAQAGQSPTGTAWQAPPSKPKKPWYRRAWVIVTGAILAIVVIAAASSGSGEQSDSGGSQAGAVEAKSEPSAAKGEQGDQPSEPGKPNEASDDNTPHVGPNGKVTVDGLVWSIGSAKAVSTIGDPSIGTDVTADGVFVVVTAKVHSTKGETATLSDDVVKLEGGSNGASYSADSEGSTAALLSSGSDAEPFFFEDVQPDTTTTGTLVYDVPKSVLSSDPELRFNELGFGEGHGYIALPNL